MRLRGALFPVGYACNKVIWGEGLPLRVLDAGIKWCFIRITELEPLAGERSIIVKPYDPANGFLQQPQGQMILNHVSGGESNNS